MLHGAGIFTNFCPKKHPNVGKYTIHRAYGIWWFDQLTDQQLTQLECIGMPSCSVFSNDYWLVVWNHGILFFHSVGNVIIPTVTHSMIFQRGRLKPPTRTADPWNAIMVWIRGFPYSWGMGPIAFVGLWMFIMENNGKIICEWMRTGGTLFQETIILPMFCLGLSRGCDGENMENSMGFSPLFLGKLSFMDLFLPLVKRMVLRLALVKRSDPGKKHGNFVLLDVHGFLYGLPVCPTLFRQCSLGWQSSVVRKICDLGGFRLNIYHSDGRSTIVFLYHPEILKSKDTPNLGLSAKTVFVTTNSTKTR